MNTNTHHALDGVVRILRDKLELLEIEAEHVRHSLDWTATKLMHAATHRSRTAAVENLIEGADELNALLDRIVRLRSALSALTD